MDQNKPTTSYTSFNFLRGIRENWFLIVFIAGLIIGWTTIKNQVENLSVAQTDLRSDQTRQDVQMNKMQTDSQSLMAAVIEIKANYIFITETLKELKAKI